MNDLVIKREDVKKLRILIEYAEANAILNDMKSLRKGCESFLINYPDLKK